MNSKEISYLFKVSTAQGEAALKKMEKKMSETDKRITEDMRQANRIRLAEEKAAINQRYRDARALKAKEVADNKRAEQQKVKDAKLAQSQLKKESVTAYRKTLFNLNQEAIRRKANLRGVAEYNKSQGALTTRRQNLYSSSGLGTVLGHLGGKVNTSAGQLGGILGSTIAGGARGLAEGGIGGIASGANLGLSSSMASAGIAGAGGLAALGITSAIGGLSFLHQQLQKIPEAITKAGKGLSSFAAHLAMLGVAVSYQVSTRIATLGKSFIQAAMDAEESQNRFDQVFKNIKDGANSTANAMAKSIGATSTDVKNSLSSLGTMMRSMGFSSDQALGIAGGLTQRAADVQSYFNVPGSVGDVTHMVRRMLVGEADPLENATGLPFTMEMYKGGIEKYKGMGAGEGFAKLLARLDYFFAATSMSAGDLMRTFNSLTNTIRRMTASWKEMGVNIGNMLSKGLDISGFFNTMGDMFSKVSEWAKGLDVNQAKAVGKLLMGLVALGPALIAAAASIGAFGLILRTIGFIGATALNPAALVVTLVLLKSFSSATTKLAESFKANQWEISLFGKSLSNTVMSIGGVVNVFFTMAEEVGRILVDLGNKIEDMFTMALAVVSGIMNKLQNMSTMDQVKLATTPASFFSGVIADSIFKEVLRRKFTGYSANQEERTNTLNQGLSTAKTWWDKIYASIFDSVLKFENKPQTLGAGIGGGEFANLNGDLNSGTSEIKGDRFAPAALYGSREAYSIIMGNKSDAMTETARNTARIAQNTDPANNFQPKFAPTSPTYSTGFHGTPALMNPAATMI